MGRIKEANGGLEGQHQQQPWRVRVCFAERGLLRAEAEGAISQLMPEDALHIITHAAGDELFRVVARRDASLPRPAGEEPSSSGGEARSVEVENRAPVRVLTWKLWAVSRVLFTVRLKPPSAPAPAAAKRVGGAQWSAFDVRPGRAGSTVAFSLVRSVSEPAAAGAGVPTTRWGLQLQRPLPQAGILSAGGGEALLAVVRPPSRPSPAPSAP
jgi:hypothetical protein